jgi:hypothetical protein
MNASTAIDGFDKDGEAHDFTAHCNAGFQGFFFASISDS